ncbi:MAG TPA: tetratricopeptide repeat protein [Terracidiphilus sp.]|jgi:tetratricopeptide (TPR) repeat protein|nr:tetratricopeptide repeat protein [Terracidiphilus sp.]
MNRPARFWALGITLAGMALSMSGCAQLEARDQLNKGVDAYKNAHYEEAIDHFQRATQLDPTLPMAKTYLATALAQNVAPGLDTPENLKTANESIRIFEEVLAKDPSDVNSMKQIAGIYFNIANRNNPQQWEQDLDNAQDWQKKVLAVDPKDPEAAYTVGVINWTKAHENLLKALQDAGLNDDGKGNVKAPKKVMEPLAKENAPLVEESLQYLNQAVQNRANYDDAMQYLNLIYRAKADVDYGNAEAVKEDLAEAQDWTSKAMSTRKANEAAKNAGPGGITMDNSGNLK